MSETTVLNYNEYNESSPPLPSYGPERTPVNQSPQFNQLQNAVSNVHEQNKINNLNPPKGWNYLIIPPLKEVTNLSKPSSLDFVPVVTSPETSLGHRTPEVKPTSPKSLLSHTPNKDGIDSPKGWNYVIIPPLKKVSTPPKGWNYVIIPQLKEAKTPSKPSIPNDENLIPSTTLPTTQTKEEITSRSQSTVSQSLLSAEGKSSTLSNPPHPHSAHKDDLEPPRGWNYVLIPPLKEVSTPPNGWNYVIIPPLMPSTRNDENLISSTTLPTTQIKEEITSRSQFTVSQSLLSAEGKSSTLSYPPPPHSAHKDGLEPSRGWNYVIIPPLKEATTPPKGWNYVIIPPLRETTTPSKPPTPNDENLIPSTTLPTTGTQTKEEITSRSQSTVSLSLLSAEGKSSTLSNLPPPYSAHRDGLEPPKGWNYVIIPPLKEHSGQMVM